MKKRKRIAVIAADIYNEYVNRILNGISEQAKQLDYDVMVFLMAFDSDSSPAIQKGEENILTLINDRSADAIILMAGNISGQNLIEHILNRLSAYDIPIVSIDYDFGFCSSIYATDADLVEQVTDHFIDHHNCRDLLCLTGPYQNVPAMTRAEGFRRSLEKHGIAYDENNIIYGDFWKSAAIELADEILSGKRKKPDGIVCANDVMGVTLCSSLIRGGIKVPDDIIISGYDGSDDAIQNIPSLTTIFPENTALGNQAVLKIHKLFTGEDAPPCSGPEGHIIFAQSCGCSDSIHYLVRRREKMNNNVQRYEHFYNRSGMLEGLMEPDTLDELLHKIGWYTYIINGLESYMLCLCTNWDNIESEDGNGFLRYGYTPVMEHRLTIEKNGLSTKYTEFPADDIIPPETDKYSDEPQMYFIIPVHHLERCFGYSIFRFNSPERTISMLFAVWNRDISIALEFLRVKTKLISINQRISLSSVRDALTGIYNRKGFKKYSEIIFDKAVAEKKKLFLLFADLDLLKSINDNYGHIEGDNAISIVANALNTACPNNEICARIGGDEFAIIGSGDYSDSEIDEIVSYIRDYFIRYNRSSQKAYEIGASIGWICEIPVPGKELSDYLNYADKLMYADKLSRRKLREKH